jgi:hypothetical protein
MDTIEQELEFLAAKNGGVVRPIDVVEFAKDPAAKLHEKFEWDDSKAGHEWRLQQARVVLNVYVKVEERTQEEHRVFVSLPSQRKKEGGGYHRLVDVMSDEQMRAEHLAQALADLQRVKKNYKQLTELSKVFAAIDEATEEHKPLQMAEAA